MRIDSTAIGGLWRGEALFDRAADNIANVNTPDHGDQPVELTDEIPAMIVAEHGYTASARVLRVQDETSRSLIDVLG
jgi:flagellar hook protein FlgE